MKTKFQEDFWPLKNFGAFLDYHIELKLPFLDTTYGLNLTIILILRHLQASTCQFCSLKSFKKLSKGCV